MCIENKTILINKKQLYINSFPKIYQRIKCGKCFECREQKRDEYIYRGQAESIYTFKNNGWIIFDTLTYNEENVPRIKDFVNEYKQDFRCFNNKHWTDYIKKLRIYIQRKYGKQHKIKPFACGEFGTSEKGTHRPHYHVIWYYTCEFGTPIKPTEFSVIAEMKWKMGRTDGVTTNGIKKFEEQKVFTEHNAHNLNVLRYIAKYTEKDSSFQKEIDRRLNQIFKYNDYTTRAEKAKIKRHICQYSRIPKAFGAYALETMNKEQVYNTMKVSYEDTKEIVKTIPLPEYYRRKLYYKLEKYEIMGEIKTKWVLTELGMAQKYDFARKQYSMIREKFIKRLQNTETNMEIETYGKSIAEKLSEYEMLRRWRIRQPRKAEEILPKMTIDENGNRHFETREQGEYLINLTTPSDKEKYGDAYTVNKIQQIGNKKYLTTQRFKKIITNTPKEEVYIRKLEIEEKIKKIKLQESYENTKKIERRAKELGLK